MIKLKKIVAIALAATMCMGLGITASADDRGSNSAHITGWDLTSPRFTPTQTNTGNVNAEGVEVEGTNGKGEQNDKLTVADFPAVNTKAYNSINTNEEVLEVLKKNGFKAKDGSEIIPIATGTITGIDKDGDNVLTFTLGDQNFSDSAYDEDKYHVGDTVYGMFETGENTGVWEVRTGIVGAGGKVDFPVTHTGAFVIIKTMKNGQMVAMEKLPDGTTTPPTVIDPQDPVIPVPGGANGSSTNKADGQNTATTTAASQWTSPKTGEF